MWIPKTEAELQQAIDQGIEESATFDAKQQIASKSVEIAKDFAAMANDGGVIIYGIGEENGQLKILTPIDLDGVPEKLAQIAMYSLQPPLKIHISAFSAEADPLKGYIVVIIPSSPFAPHQVTVKQENRFYGRSSRGNIPLNEGDIARLYQRRLAGETSAREIIKDAVKILDIPPHPDYGRMYIAIKPTQGFTQVFSGIPRFNDADWNRSFYELVAKAHQAYNFNIGFNPSFIDGVQNDKRIIEGWKFRAYRGSDPAKNHDILASNISVNVHHDGSIYICCGRISEKGEDWFFLFEAGIAKILVQTLWIANHLYQQAGYIGNLNIGLRIEGIQGSKVFRGQSYDSPIMERDSFETIAQHSALVVQSNILGIAEELIKPFLIEATQGTYNPFEKDITLKS
ncbi:MAG: ATP-binding protein [Chloroflexi bacterium]|nr:ATP-binding protein [Chloroflexota bacterium]